MKGDARVSDLRASLFQKYGIKDGEVFKFPIISNLVASVFAIAVYIAVISDKREFYLDIAQWSALGLAIAFVYYAARHLFHFSVNFSIKD